MEAGQQLRRLAAGPAAAADAAPSRSAQAQPPARAPYTRGWLDLLTFDSGPGVLGGDAPADTAAQRVTANSPSGLVKVVVGNKKLMSQEDVAVPPTIDDYMREMEVRAFVTLQGPP